MAERNSVETIMLPQDRIVALDKVDNFRDVGGLQAGNGCLMKKGRIYRSGSLHSLSRKGIMTIDGMGIKTILDLRTPNERKRKPFKVRGRTDIRLESIPIYPMPEKADPSTLHRLIGFLSGKYRELDLQTVMHGFYHRIALDHLVEFKKILTFISDDSNLPCIIHCQGGKDRTGWVSALCQSVAGVPRDVIYEDYLLTNKFLLRDIRKQKRMIKWFTFFQYDFESVRPVMEARREYLKSAFEAVLSRYGSIEGYLENGCGIPRATLLNIKKIFCG